MFRRLPTPLGEGRKPLSDKKRTGEKDVAGRLDWRLLTPVYTYPSEIRRNFAILRL